MLCSRAAARLHASACIHLEAQKALQEARETARSVTVCNYRWRRTIVLCLLRQHHLRVALWPQGPRFQQRFCEVDTPLVHVQASRDLQ